MSAVTLIKFQRAHLEELAEQEATAYLRPHLSALHLELWEASDWCFTGLAGGAIFGCGGIHDWYPSTPFVRGEAFAILDRARCRSIMVAVHAAVKQLIERCPFRRIEATVDAGFVAGLRWVELLGFRLETERGMEGYRPDGRKAFLYSIVKGAA